MWEENKLFLHWSFDSFIFSTVTNDSLTVHDTSGGEIFSMCALLLMLQVQLATLMGVPLPIQASRKQAPQNKMSFCCFNDINQLVEGSGKNQSGASGGSI